MRRGATITAALLALGLLGCGDGFLPDLAIPEVSANVPAGWTWISECDGHLEFALPPDQAEMDEGQPVDSCVGHFEGIAQRFFFDHGRFGGDLDDMLGPPFDDVVSWYEIVDGRLMHFVTAHRAGWDLPYVAAAFVEQVNPGGQGTLRLSSDAATAATRDRALTTFRSVDFTP